MPRPAAGPRGAWHRPAALGPGHPVGARLTALLGVLALTTFGLLSPLALAVGGATLQRAGTWADLRDEDALLVAGGMTMAVLPLGFWVLLLPFVHL